MHNKLPLLSERHFIDMKTLGNIVWLVFGGILIALMYYIAGFVLCITIIGIPFGLQLFKLGTYTFWPFGYELGDKPNEPGCFSIVFNVLWIMLGWWEIAIAHALFGALLCITIVGFPLGLAHFKIALASLLPFGKEIRKK